MSRRAKWTLFGVRGAGFGLLFAGVNWIGSLLVCGSIIVEWRLSHRGLPRLPWREKVFVAALGLVCVAAGLALVAAMYSVGMGFYSAFTADTPTVAAWFVMSWVFGALTKMLVAFGNWGLRARARTERAAERVPRRFRAGGWQA